MESIRSRFFNGVELNSKKAIWVKWCKVLASKDKGGLGVSSLFALNKALLIKWVWRFKTQNNLLWTRVIKAIHGDKGRFGIGSKKKIGNGKDTSFWDDVWIGDVRPPKCGIYSGHGSWG
ncbi:hypothetical protein Tco_0376134, partial [Tanacetum coccineum]